MDYAQEIAKLRTELDAMQAKQDVRLTINREWRNQGEPDIRDVDAWPRIVAAAGLEPSHVEPLIQMMSQWWETDRVPFPKSVFAETNDDKRAIEREIAELDLAGVTVKCELQESTEDNRIRLLFSTKPEESVRHMLRGRGFKWAPRHKAWQRPLDDAGRKAAQAVLAILT